MKLVPEWSKQQAVIVAWPDQYTDFKDRLLQIESVYLQLAKAITLFQNLIILVRSQSNNDHVLALLTKHNVNLSRCQLIEIPFNDIWIRDYGPLSMQDKQGQMHWLNYQFNGWGEKYPFDLDNQVTRALYANESMQWISSLQSSSWVLEGGSIDCNQQGDLLTTSACLLNENRNKKNDKKEIEQRLKQNLGIKRIHWLNHGYLAGDDTDGHIDNLARFCSDTTIIYASCRDENDEHYEALKLMEQELQSFKQANGDAFRLMPLPIPMVLSSIDGRRLPASYVNFLIISDAVLVPTYQVPTDFFAIDIISQCFPERHVMGIDSRALLEQNGSLHCATMQLHSAA